MRAIDNLQLAESVCAVSPTIREARRVHQESFGTLIPHVFMSDVLAHVGWCLRHEAAGGGAHHGELLGILECLERAMAHGDRETRNVVAISFASDAELEHFIPQLVPLLGPKVRAQLTGR